MLTPFAIHISFSVRLSPSCHFRHSFRFPASSTPSAIRSGLPSAFASGCPSASYFRSPFQLSASGLPSAFRPARFCLARLSAAYLRLSSVSSVLTSATAFHTLGFGLFLMTFTLLPCFRYATSSFGFPSHAIRFRSSFGCPLQVLPSAIRLPVSPSAL